MQLKSRPKYEENGLPLGPQKMAALFNCEVRLRSLLKLVHFLP